MQLSKEQMAINRLMCGNTAHSKNADYIQLAIKALEKQIPKKPYDENKDKAGWHSIYRCPCCNEWVEEEGYGDILIRFNWCNNCGQKIDWSGLIE